MRLLRQIIPIAAVCVCAAPFSAWATKPKLDPDTCNSLRLEEIKFRQSGVLNDMSKGAAWAKANLSADRLAEIKHYLELEEQVQFGCRDTKITAEAKRASEAAARIEINSDADPTVPISKDPPKPGAAAAQDTGKKTVKKKIQKGKSAKTSKDKESRANIAPHPPVIVQSDADTGSDAASSQEAPSLPAFGFGQTEVLPWSSP